MTAIIGMPNARFQQAGTMPSQMPFRGLDVPHLSSATGAVAVIDIDSLVYIYSRRWDTAAASQI